MSAKMRSQTSYVCGAEHLSSTIHLSAGRFHLQLQSKRTRIKDGKRLEIAHPAGSVMLSGGGPKGLGVALFPETLRPAHSLMCIINGRSSC
jgi:hypothetical protein